MASSNINGNQTKRAQDRIYARNVSIALEKNIKFPISIKLGVFNIDELFIQSERRDTCISLVY